MNLEKNQITNEKKSRKKLKSDINLYQKKLKTEKAEKLKDEKTEEQILAQEKKRKLLDKKAFLAKAKKEININEYVLLIKEIKDKKKDLKETFDENEIEKILKEIQITKNKIKKIENIRNAKYTNIIISILFISIVISNIIFFTI